ncbi:MAG: SMC-Scp complex subunit ScpB [Candidatus Pacearchaeota archaeon]
MDEKTRKIEALLFIAGRFLNEADIVRLTGIDPLSLREAINELRERYKESALGLTEIEIDGIKHYRMEVKDEYKQLALGLATKQEFSKAEQATLALIAYKQPIKQSVVVKIRGNKAYEHIKKFLAYGLINAKPHGHTAILSLSQRFYEYFELKGKEKGEEKEQKLKE